MNKSLFAIIFFFLSLDKLYSQEIRTFNTFNFTTSLSEKINNYSVAVGEMLQIKSAIPFRILVSAQYTGKITRPGIWSSNIGTFKTPITVNKNLFTSNISIPIGGEMYYKNIGLGFIQEIINLNLSKSFDSTKVSTPTNQELKLKGVTSIFSKQNNLNTTLYLVYTISDSFSVKLGVRQGNEFFRHYADSKDIGYSKIRDHSFYISIRTNLEK